MRARSQEAPVRGHDQTIASGDAKHIAFKSGDLNEPHKKKGMVNLG